METAYLQTFFLKPRTGVLAILLLGFAVGLSGCKSSKTEDAPKPITGEVRKLKAGDLKIIGIANRFVVKKGKDLNSYNPPEITEQQDSWDVFYDNKTDLYGGDLLIIVDRASLQSRFNDCYKLKTGDPKIIELAEKFAVEHGKDLNLYEKVPMVFEMEDHWSIYYRQKGKYVRINGDLALSVSKTTCRVRFVPQI